MKSLKTHIIESLKFKRVGQFAEELSHRYEAKLNDDVVVRITKDVYTRQWNTHFLTKSLFMLDSNQDFDYFYSNSKAETIRLTIDCIQNEKNFVEKITAEAYHLEQKMQLHLTK